MNKPEKPSRTKMSEEKRSYLFLAVVLVLTLVIGIVSITGMPLDSRGLYKLKSWVPFVSADNWPASVPLGLGIGGGSFVEYEAALPEGSVLDLDKALNDTVSILQTRLTSKGYLDSVVLKTAEGKIRVEIPNAKDRSDVLYVLSASGNLVFSFPDGTFLEGGHVKSASVRTNTGSAQPVVLISLDNQGTKALSDASTENAGNVLTIQMDGQTLASATVGEAIINGEITITTASIEGARNLVNVLRSGVVPVKLTQGTVGDVAATQGGGILNLFVIGGLVLMLAAMAYFVVRYMLGGVAVALALWIHVIFTYFLLAVFPMAQLTLPGLVGIALGFGLFVWANDLLLQKFALGLRPGRMHKVSLKEGWASVRQIVWKVHVACLAAALVLLVLPIGIFHSFASAALFAVGSSLLVTWIASRLILIHTARAVKKNPARFGHMKNA